jgi:hypothetical protein
MKSLYQEILKLTGGDRQKKFPIINRSALIPILRGNNVVVEKFTISTSMFGREKYRMYLKIGAKAKLPDEVRLPSLKVYDQKLGNLSLNLKGSLMPEREKTFGNNNNKKGGAPPTFSTDGYTNIEFRRKVQEILGEAIEYSKTKRSLVLEFKTIRDAIDALNYLPFGLNYSIKLLDA